MCFPPFTKQQVNKAMQLTAEPPTVKESTIMAAYLQDRRSALLERRQQYELEVAEALLDEDYEEREERLRLVRASQAMLANGFINLEPYDPEEYKD
jgi:hypothetical protein